MKEIKKMRKEEFKKLNDGTAFWKTGYHVIISCNYIQTWEQLAEALGNAFQFPMRNEGFDGTWDWLTDLSWLGKQPRISIYFYESEKLLKGDRKLKEEVLNMSQGDLNHPMTIKSHDELSILAREVDILRTTLDSNYQNESKIKEAHQELITSLSHDLRTPLTTLRGYLDILSLHCYKDEKQMDHYLKGCIEKTEQIKDLSNKTFEYALVFEQDLLPQLETIQSEQFIYYLQENLEYLELEGFRIEKEIDICSVDLQLDLSMMKRMINNICSNILKYAKKDKPIYLEISIKQGKIKIVFENEKKKDLQKIESNKIGLKSVQKIVETHHGQLFIQDLPETFVLIITLPYN